MTHALRFAGRLIWPWLIPFALIPLAVAWVILSVIVGVWSLWVETAR